MTKKLLIAVCAWLIGGQSLVAQQSQYPATEYRGFGFGQSAGVNDFATVSPEVPDAADSTNYRAMSPSSWDAIQSRENVPSKKNVPNQSPKVAPTDFDFQANVTDNRILTQSLKGGSNESFQSASYSKNNDAALPVSPKVPDNIRYSLSTPANSNNQLHSSHDMEVDSLDASQNSARYDALTKITNSIIRTPQNEPTQTAETNSSTANFDKAPEYVGPGYRPDLGHRAGPVTERKWEFADQGEKFDFEKKKKEYPPMKEILATGRYFGSATALYLKPAFQGNTAISSTGTGVSTPFDFDHESALQFQVGFESKYGPGVELNYWQYDESSNPSTFTSNGSDTGTTSAWMRGPNQWSRLSASNSGESINAVHSLDVESVGACFFKEVKLPISRINGKFGFQYVSIAHDLNASLTDSGATEIGSLKARSDMRAYGPQFQFEYFRPVGHTKLELYTTAGGSVLFGKQDQFVENSATGDLSRVGADEFLTMTDFMSGLQYRKNIGENRSWFVRGGFTFQSWLGGGTAILPQDDFGLRGFALSVGMNR